MPLLSFGLLNTPTTSPVSFNFAHISVLKVLLIRPFYKQHTDGVLWFSLRFPSKFPENFTLILLGIAVIEVAVVVLVLIVAVLVALVLVAAVVFTYWI